MSTEMKVNPLTVASLGQHVVSISLKDDHTHTHTHTHKGSVL